MNEEIPTKLCRKCGETKPLTKEFWYWRDGCRWSSPCIVCQRAAKNERRAKDPETVRAWYRAWRAAHQKQVRAQDRAWRAENVEQINQRRRAQYAANGERIRARNRAWRQANPEKARTSLHRWYTANKSRVLEASRKWREANQERRRATDKAWREKNAEKERLRSQHRQSQYPERWRAWRRNWKKANLEQVRVHAKNRRAREKNAEGSFTLADLRRIFAEQGGKCAYCGDQLYLRKRGGLSIDHVIPLVRGGSNYPENLVCACISCNSSKNDRLLDEWIAVRGW